jgi:hypothetical protein
MAPDRAKSRQHGFENKGEKADECPENSNNNGVLPDANGRGIRATR